jgi:hypothetical protein
MGAGSCVTQNKKFAYAFKGCKIGEGRSRQPVVSIERLNLEKLEKWQILNV